MKIIVYYLPQYHEIEENNKWWGRGFTEWTNLKKAKALYPNHYQPRIPLNKNYYDLMKKESVIWQNNLAIENGIEGFCYYHYWFEGKKILEKPAENLLKWRDINQKFCFCWANHSWRKTWNGTMEMLIEQKYGDIQEWEAHISYLLKFFKDERYIKIDNKPIFMIYSTKDIENIDERVLFYDKKCKENGFDGIYIIESLSNFYEKNISKNSSAIVLREPNVAFSRLNFFQKLNYRIKRRINPKYIKTPAKFITKIFYEKSIKSLSEVQSSKTVMAGAFSEWDSTPRHSKRGYVIENSSLDDFEKYLSFQKKIMKERKIEYMFFNAWNEWAEGMYLEPDEKNKDGYLKIIKKIVETCDEF